MLRKSRGCSARRYRRSMAGRSGPPTPATGSLSTEGCCLTSLVSVEAARPASPDLLTAAEAGQLLADRLSLGSAPSNAAEQGWPSARTQRATHLK
jgi:hypothetical protein